MSDEFGRERIGAGWFVLGLLGGKIVEWWSGSLATKEERAGSWV